MIILFPCILNSHYSPCFLPLFIVHFVTYMVNLVSCHCSPCDIPLFTVDIPLFILCHAVVHHVTYLCSPCHIPAHLTYLVHKSGRKTPIIIIILTLSHTAFYNLSYHWSPPCDMPLFVLQLTDLDLVHSTPRSLLYDFDLITNRLKFKLFVCLFFASSDN